MVRARRRDRVRADRGLPPLARVLNRSSGGIGLEPTNLVAQCILREVRSQQSVDRSDICADRVARAPQRAVGDEQQAVMRSAVTDPARRDRDEVADVVGEERSLLGGGQCEQGLVLGRDQIRALAYGDGVMSPLSEASGDVRWKLLVQEQLQPSTLCSRSQRSRSRSAASISAAA